MLFLKKQKGNLEANGFSKAAGPFRIAIREKQLKVANGLAHKTKGCSPVQIKIGLVLFCLLFGGLSAYVLVETIRFKKPAASGIFMPRLLPFHARRSFTLVPPVISSADIHRLERVKLVLDSLRRKDTAAFNHVMASQPKLLENIRALESIYQPQKK